MRSSGSDTQYTESWTGSSGSIEYLARADGSRLRYYTVGAGPVVVLLHTVRTQLDYFQQLIPQLWNSCTVYALDFPGMGWSDIAAQARYEESDMRTAVVEFINRVDLHDVTLVGESMGASIALTASIELADRVTRVVALNPYDYPGGLERGNLLAKLIGTSIRTPLIGSAVAAVETHAVLTRILRGGFVDPGNLPDHFVRELRRSGRRRGYPRVGRTVMRNLTGLIAARDRYAQVQHPVTLVYGDHDWSDPVERRHVEGLLPQVESLMLTSTGHFSSLERPTDVARIVLARTKR